MNEPIPFAKTFGPALILLLFPFLMHLAGTGTLPLVDRDEAWVAETAREMHERGNYIVPYFNNEKSLTKPPLFYWGQTLSYRLFGENDFAARFPSVVAASLISLLIFGFGRRFYNEQTGFLAAVVFSLCLHILLISKAAVMDMFMIFFVTLAIWAGWELLAIKEKPPSSLHFGFWWWIFYLALAFGFLAKGPVAWIPLGNIIFFAIWARVRNVNEKMRFEKGIPLALLLVGLWVVPACILTKGEYFKIGFGNQFLLRFIKADFGHGAHSLRGYFVTLPFYLVTLFFSFFPWSIYLPSMTGYFKKRKNRGVQELYLISNILPIFLIATLMVTKLPNYTLPAFPALALLFSRYWFKEKSSGAIFMTAATGMVVLNLVLAFILFPYWARYFPVPQLLHQSSAWLKPEMEFASTGYNEPSLVWYFRGKVRGWYYRLQSGEVDEFMKKPGPRFAILPTQLVPEIFSKVDPHWKIISAKGVNMGKMKQVNLTMLVKSE